MSNENSTILLREYLAPLCGWKLVRPDDKCVVWWEKEGCERINGSICPIEHSIESAHNCLPDGVILLRIEWDIDHNTKERIQITFNVMYEDGSTQALIVPTGKNQEEILWRFHLAIWMHEKIKERNGKIS